MFSEAADKRAGISFIAKALNKDRVPTFGKSNGSGRT